ncbi:MAG TPA: hypothetical protein VG860_17055, partial [Terriglobia bacterium]|nr:hypothetical protein [Terriglobia bacterium]
MAKKGGMAKHDLEVAEFLRLGGRKIPAGLAAKARAAAMKSTLPKKPGAGTDLRVQGAKLYGELKGASPIAVDDPANRGPLEAILRLHKKVASKKLAFPVVLPGGGPVSVVFSGPLGPPFDFADSALILGINPNGTFEVGNPTRLGTANVNGQISASAVTPETGESAGGELAQVGSYFCPPGPGTLTISASPTYSFEFLTNSLNTAPVYAEGWIELIISGVDEQGDLPFRLGHRMLGTYDFGSNVTHFLHANALGSSTVITDGTGSVVNEQLF